MKFSLKVFFSTLLVTTIVFSVGGYLIISRVFDTALEREMRLASEESQILRLSFQNMAAGSPTPLTLNTSRRLAQALESNGNNSRFLRLSDLDGTTLYTSIGFPGSFSPLSSSSGEQQVWQIRNQDGGWYIQTACQVTANERTFHLESIRDITYLFQQRGEHFSLYRWLVLAGLVVISAAVYLLSHVLTAPIRRLSGTTREFAAGNYSLRAKVITRDEIGALTEDFNSMADSLEQKISALEEASRRQEQFIASFAHELKTPLTAIIGYADMLRSQDLSAEHRFQCADYIYHEGHRLESLSFKLLELIVVKREHIPFRPSSVDKLVCRLEKGLSPVFLRTGVHLQVSCPGSPLFCEPDLLLTALLNLCDNARKASSAGDTVYLSGSISEQWYSFTVVDQGIGMTEEQLANATQPFFMADKSRSRAQNGAGLGLSLCAAVAELHGGTLHLHSVPEQGTTVTLTIPTGGAAQ